MMEKVLSLQNLSGNYMDPCSWSSVSCDSDVSCRSGVSSVTTAEEVDEGQ
jgi:hypothetical protein